MEATVEGIDSHVVEPDWLAAILLQHESNVRVIDMRGSVRTTLHDNGEQEAEYLGARDLYLNGHIPGAVYLDWTVDIVDRANPVPVQVADSSTIADVMGRAGIDDNTIIVAYDSHPSLQFATRLWWVMKYYGNNNVRVLNGGWPRWVAENRTVSVEVPSYERRVFTATEQPQLLMSAHQLESILGTSGFELIDARDIGQFRGDIRRGKRGGHIPGAVNVPREEIFSAPCEFKSPEKMQAAFGQCGIEVDTDKRFVAYCNGGVAATSVLFALSILGCRHLTNYDGSWNEWNLIESLPVE